MIQHSLKRHGFLLGVIGISLAAAFHGFAQGRGGGGGGGFGNFGGGGAIGGSRTSSTSGGSGSQSYTPNGQIGDVYFSIDPETRRIVYIADETTAKYVHEVLANLDRPKPQVLIKVLFLEVGNNKALDLGIEGTWHNNSPDKAAVTQGFGLSPASANLGTNLNSSGQPLASFLPASPMTSPGAGLFTVLGTDYNVTIRAIQQAGNAKVLSRPSILARNNQPATITVGSQVPLITSVRYDTLGNAINSVTYQDVGVILKVTPFITADGLVEMMVSPQISEVDSTQSTPITTGVSSPYINITSADTVVVTADGQTVIIGGLIQTKKAKNDTKIPLLGDIPLLGALFTHTQRADTKSELLIFLTPHIVLNPNELAALSAREQAKSQGAKDMTQQELNQFLDRLPDKQPELPVAPKSGSK
jgi:type II secretion system protein D